MREINDWKLIDEKNQEIAELKSMVDILQRAARQTDNQFRIHAKLDSDTKTILSCALNKTPAQCLQSVKADTLNDLVEVLRETGPPNQIEASVRTHNSICNSIEGVIKIMREGES